MCHMWCSGIAGISAQLGGKLEGDFGSKPEGDPGSKLEGDAGKLRSKLEQ